MKSIPFHFQINIAGLDAVTASLPGGAYTTIRTYQGNQVIRLQDQVVRLEQSARLAGKPVLLDEARLRGALRSALAQARKQLANVLTDAGEIADLRLRLTLDLESQPGDLYIAIELLEVPPQEAYREGVAIVTCTLERLQPEAKLTRFIARSQHIRQSLPPGVNEAVMVSAQGFLLEGLTSNFFAVSHDEIRTAGEGVLAGITRGLVLDSARRLGLSVRFTAGSYFGVIHITGSFYHQLQPWCFTSVQDRCAPYRYWKSRSACSSLEADF